jgi:hypothetical protein
MTQSSPAVEKLPNCGKEGKVFVLNIFTAYGENFRDAAVLLGPARYAEEAQAAQTLDYEYKNSR